MKAWYRLAKDERGAAIVLVAVSMFAIMAAVALAVDASRLLVARTEAQRAADSGALAGAGWLIVDPDDEPGARSRAETFAEQNIVRGMTPDVRPEDIDVILDSSKVRVRVRMQADRSLAIPTFFARVFGVSQVDVTTVAAAWAAPSSGTEAGGEDTQGCLLPVGLLDYYDANGDGFYTDGEPALGFDQDDHGLLFKLTASGSTPQGGPPICRSEPVWDPVTQSGVYNANPDADYCNGYEDSWSCWWREDEPSQGGGGGSTYLGDMVLGNNCVTLDPPTQVWQASAGGEKQSLVSSDDMDGGPGSFLDIIQQDLADNGGTDLVWCAAGTGGTDFPPVGCAMRGSCRLPTAGDPDPCETEGSRFRTAPIIGTDNISGSGANNTFDIIGITGVLIEKVACSYNAGQLGGPAGNMNVYIRIITSGAGAPGGSGEDPGENSLLRRLQLIE